MRCANHRAAASAAGMYVGLGRSGSCSVWRRTPRPSGRGLARSRIAVSSDCITSRITVRRDHLNGHSRRIVRSGCFSIAAIHFSGRVTPVPPPVRAVNRVLIRSASRP